MPYENLCRWVDSISDVPPDDTELDRIDADGQRAGFAGIVKDVLTAAAGEEVYNALAPEVVSAMADDVQWAFAHDVSCRHQARADVTLLLGFMGIAPAAGFVPEPGTECENLEASLGYLVTPGTCGVGAVHWSLYEEARPQRRTAGYVGRDALAAAAGIGGVAAVECYGRLEVWRDPCRAAEYYTEAKWASEGPERERYDLILWGLSHGARIASDKESGPGGTSDGSNALSEYAR